MKIIYFLLFFQLFIASSVTAQVDGENNVPESLLKERLVNCGEGVDKIKIHIAIGRAMLYRAGAKHETIDSAMNFGTVAETESHKINFNEGVINAMVLKALCFYKKDKSDPGFTLAKQALALAQKVKNNNGIAESYIAMGQYYPYSEPKSLRSRTLYYDTATVIFRKEHNMHRLATILEDDAEWRFLDNKKTEAIKILFEALNVHKALGNKNLQGVYWMIGRTSNGLGDYPDAIKYNLLAIKAAKTVGDSSLKLCSIYHSLAATYIGMGDFRQALPYSLEALKIARRYKDRNYIITVAFAAAAEYTRINRFDQALPLLHEMEKNDPDGQNEMIITASYLNNFNYARQFDKAAFYAQKLKKVLNKFSSDDFNAFTIPFSFLANYYADTRQINMAYHYANLHSAIPPEKRTAVTNRSIENVYFHLDSLKGDFKAAIKHYRNAQKIKDSVDNVTKAYQISLLQIENDTEKKNDEIDALNKRALVRDAVLKRNQLMQRVTVAGSLLLVIITILIYSRYKLKQRSNALLMKQKSEIDHQNIELQLLVNDKNQLIGDKDCLLLEKDVLLLEKDLLLKDKDLLIKEVNHRVKNNLQIVMSLLQSQSGYLQNKEAQDAILEGQNRVQTIAIMHDQLFRADNVTQINLLSYISELVHCLNHSINKGSQKVTIRFDVDAIMLDVAQAIPVGIILNETVTNALKYAFPGDLTGQILITVKQIEQEIQMRISDDGVGLSSDLISGKAGSLGMKLIRGLSRQLKGKFEFINNNGVTVAVAFPVEVSGVVVAKTGQVTESV